MKWYQTNADSQDYKFYNNNLNPDNTLQFAEVKIGLKHKLE